MSDLIALVQAEVERAMRSYQTEAYGTVTSYDPDSHSVKVMVQPDGTETGWIRVGEQHIGNGWGILSGLQINDQVKLSIVKGDINNATISGRVHSDQDKPPKVEAGEMILQHTSGSMIKFGKDNSVTMNSAAAMTINSTGTLTING